MNAVNAHDPNEETCLNCACFARMLPDGRVVGSDQIGQGVCRRNQPAARMVPGERPLHDAKGNPMMDNKGQPRMERVQVVQIGYPPTEPHAICWDGWRPLGTRPGAARVSPGN